jgi:hypothetical protein
MYGGKTAFLSRVAWMVIIGIKSLGTTSAPCVKLVYCRVIKTSAKLMRRGVGRTCYLKGVGKGVPEKGLLEFTIPS